jgi:proteasome accessory factor C
VSAPRPGTRAPSLSALRPTATWRLQRLLSLIPWVAARDGPSVDEICERFDIGRSQLLVDLTLASMVGVHPYTPDELIEVVVEDDRVWVRYALSFGQSLRLTPEQGLALVAAGAGLLAVPGADPDGPLARGLDKLASSLGLAAGETMEVSVGEAPAATLADLRDAIASRHQVEIDYYAYGRDDRTQRVVDPYRVYADQGHWYLLGHCHLVGGERLFRVDRIADARILDSEFDAPATPPTLGVYQPRRDDPRVTLELDASARWVSEQYPVETVEESEGGLRVTLAVSAVPWLERLLLRLGPHARVVAQTGGDHVLGHSGADAARRILGRYAEGSSGKEGTPLG